MPERTAEWPLHLKAPALLDIGAVLSLPVTHSATAHRLEEVMVFFRPEFYQGLRTSRTMKTTSLSIADTRQAVEKGKFELAMPAEDQRRLFRSSRQYEREDAPPGAATFGRLPDGWHGVNVFYVPELKGRRRLITEPLLNGVVSKESLPRVAYPCRLEKRQRLRYCRYLLQIDFDAFYDAIPLHDPVVRNMFVFRGRGGLFYRLKTLPTGARWSVCVAQAITSAIVDIDIDKVAPNARPACPHAEEEKEEEDAVLIMTIIENIMIAAERGREAEFVRAARSILDRIGRVNLQTSPARQELQALTDTELLTMAMGPNVFLGEEYTWDDALGERVMRNATKTVAKLNLSLARFPRYTCRTFAGLVSLVLFGARTIGMNPARLYMLSKAYRAVYIAVGAGLDWDDPVPHISPRVEEVLRATAGELQANRPARILPPIHASYHKSDYDLVILTDASIEGWGAIVTDMRTQTVSCIQKRWGQELVRGGHGDGGGHVPAGRVGGMEDPHGRWAHRRFQQRHSAHAEPRAARECLTLLYERGQLAPGMRVALATGHVAIVLAQGKHNGYGGIGRGGSLNLLYERVHAIFAESGIVILFFCVAGPQNPADSLSRQFDQDGCLLQEWEAGTENLAVPFLRQTFCPLCEEGGRNE